jgi:hypothetical protein
MLYRYGCAGVVALPGSGGDNQLTRQGSSLIHPKAGASVSAFVLKSEVLVSKCWVAGHLPHTEFNPT